MSRQNESFVFYGSFYDAVKCIEDKQTRLEFYEFTIRYALENVEPDIKGVNADLKKAIWIQIKFAIDNAQERRKSCVDSGKKGGRPSSKKQCPSLQPDETTNTSESADQDESTADLEIPATQDVFNDMEADARTPAKAPLSSVKTIKTEGFSDKNPRFNNKNLNINVNRNINKNINANVNVNKEKPDKRNGFTVENEPIGTGTGFLNKERIKKWFLSNEKLGKISEKTAVQISERLEALGFSMPYLDYCLKCVLTRYESPAVNSGLVVSAITSWQELAESYKELLSEEEIQERKDELAASKSCLHCGAAMEFYPGEIPEWYCRKCRIHFKPSAGGEGLEEEQ